MVRGWMKFLSIKTQGPDRRGWCNWTTCEPSHFGQKAMEFQLGQRWWGPLDASGEWVWAPFVGPTPIRQDHT